MLKLKKVAVTGGLSSGKSSVCHLFGELGAHVVSADEVVHQLLTPATYVGQKVIQLIGSEIVIQDKIDRSLIAKKVFNHPKLLKALEQILHPEVRDEIEEQYQKACKQGLASLFVAEIPLLDSSFGHYDYTIAVVADENLCKKRFIQKTGYPEDEYIKRMSQQLSPLEKAKNADFVIVNNGTLDELRSHVIDIYSKINP